MKVSIGNYPTYYSGGSKFLDKLVARNILSNDTSDSIYRFLIDFWPIKKVRSYLKRRDRMVSVRIDKHDTYNLADTLALVILPALKLYREHSNGSARVANEDVPQSLHRPDGLESYDIDDNWDKRWEYVLDEMIWAFEQTNTDWEDQYWSGKADIYFEKSDINGYYEVKYGPNHTFSVEQDALNNHYDRMMNGFRLFGKYYHNLWW